MAVIKCRLTGGKLEVVQVLRFQAHDEIQLEEGTELFEMPKSWSQKPKDCLIVRRPFSPGGRITKKDLFPCPGN